VIRPIASKPSMLWRCRPVSIESAITSRDTSEYFIPSVPIEMASLTVMVPNVCGMAARLPARNHGPRSVKALRRECCKGVIVLYAIGDAKMIGFCRSSPSPEATARSQWPVRGAWTPAVIGGGKRSIGQNLAGRRIANLNDSHRPGFGTPQLRAEDFELAGARLRLPGSKLLDLVRNSESSADRWPPRLPIQ